MDGLLGAGVGVVVLALLLTAAEWIDPEVVREPGAPRHARVADLRWFVVYLGYAPLTAAGAMAVVALVAPHGPGHALVARLSPGLQCVGAFVVADACAYWTHRAMHAVPALWRFHRVHHETTTVRWWTTFRFHPVDGVLAHAIPLAVAAACGFGVVALSGYVAVLFVVTVFAHADVFVPGRHAARLVALPRFHRTHHETDRDRTNFAVVLPVWDMLFGTAVHDVGSRHFGPATQRRMASPIASEPTLATQLAASAPSAPVRPRRHTNPASR